MSEAPLKRARLDFFLISSRLMNVVTSSCISYGYRSDPSLISAAFKLGNVILGKGYWKFNNSLLHDECYVNMIKDTINNVIKEYC